jgi:hypothetical protein
VLKSKRFGIVNQILEKAAVTFCSLFNHAEEEEQQQQDEPPP